MKKEGLIERFCQLLGRQNFASDFLDNLLGFIFPPSPFAVASGIPMTGLRKTNRRDILGKRGQLLMARPPAGTENFHGPAPVAPHTPHGFEEPTRTTWEWLFGDSAAHARGKTRARTSQSHSRAPCSNPMYQGMHGRPCAHGSGTDNMCPIGTVSGWWWSYEVPRLGRIYYVDCCGGRNSSDVWCNWSNEDNWCFGLGRAQSRGISDYNCTLAILEADMNVVAVGTSWEVIGVDPAP